MIFKSYFLVATLSITIFLISYSCKQAPTDAPVIITQITGKVTDKQNNQPIVGAQITTNPVTSSVVTGSDGNYTIPDVKSGQYTITAKKDGYNDNTTTVSVTEGKSVNADIQITKLSPELSVSPIILDFKTTDTNLIFYISNKSQIGTVTWTITTNQSWISISPKIGTTTTETDPIQVIVDRSSLSFGNYSGQITITSDAGDKSINVLMTKSNPSAPQLTISPSTLDFGSTLTTSQVEVKNTGTGTMSWNGTPSTNWIVVSSQSGNLNAGNSVILNISINKNGLTPGNYNGSVLFNSNGGSQTLSITMIVPPGILTAPTLQLNGEPTTTSISIGWTKNTEAQFQSYKIYRSTTPGVTESSTLITTITFATTNSFTDNNLQSSTTYYYRVFVYNNSGIGSGSNELSVTTARAMGSWVVTNTINVISGRSNLITPNSLFPLSDNDVWIVADNEIWHYDGNSWNKVFSLNTYSHFNAIFFLNSNLGWAITNDSKMYQYNGINWVEVFSGAFGYNILYDIIAFSTNDIWVCSNASRSLSNQIYHYSNGQWTQTSLNSTLVFDLDFIDSNNIWALGQDGKVFKYNGIGWALIQTIPGSGFKQIDVINNNDVWVSTSSTFSSSYSGLWHYDGVSFISNYKLSSGSSYNGGSAIAFISSNEGWRYQYYNGFNSPSGFSYFNGTAWKSVANPTSSDIECIRFLTNKKGWAVSSSGDILRYTE